MASQSSSNDDDFMEEETGNSLPDRLIEALEPGFPNGRFLPCHRLQELVDREAVEASLPEATEELLKFISSSALKVFAIILCSNCLPQHKNVTLQAAMEACRMKGLVDDKLPLPHYDGTCDDDKCNCPGLADMDQSSRTCRDSLARTVFAEWGENSHENFFQRQWQFLAPVFDARRFDYELGEHSILPIRRGKGHGEGNFGDIIEGYLHEQHGDGYQWSGNLPYRIAIKEFKHSVKNAAHGMTAKRAWEAEAKNLRELSEQAHPNLVHRIAAIQLGDRFFLLSQWADGGDLKSFWEGFPTPSLSPGLTLEILVQLKGLASAIRRLHTGGSSSLLSSSSSDEGRPGTRLPASPSPPVVAVDGVVQAASEVSGTNGTPNWRHGDLKPENILIFKVAGKVLGDLRVSDLGLAKRHFQATGLRKTPSTTKFATSAYEPPEAITMSENPRSRLYDIWSFGCIMLELLVWSLYGHSGLDELWKIPPGTNGTLFYSIRDPQVEPRSEVNKHVTAVIDAILAKDPECEDIRKPSAIRDVLLLVKTKALVAALPGSLAATLSGQHRIDATELLQELESIISKCETLGDKYKFTGRNRSHVQFPMILNIPSSPPKKTGQFLSPASISPGGGGGSNRNLRQSPAQAQRETYTHEPLDQTDWKIHLDNVFAAELIQSKNATPSLIHSTERCSLCERCESMDRQLSVNFSASIQQLQSRQPDCAFCRLLLHLCSARMSEQLVESRFQVRRERSKIVIEQGRRVFRALSITQSVDHTSVHFREDIQIGLPSSHDIHSPTHSKLLQSWLHDCDENHQNCCRGLNEKDRKLEHYPTRLVEIGHDQSLRLVECQALDLDASSPTRPQYLALSYTWGATEVHKHYFTTWENYRQHKDRIPREALPLLFLHAIQVAETLGIDYLWIDTLCIIQGEGGDFGAEVKRMETVFSGAYCVIAASRCTGASDGFLKDRPKPESIVLPNSGLRVTEDIDDFQHDVIDGRLNKRGWVLQERALARRTIFFTENQTYWECGEGVRCETLTKMKNNQAAFLGDSNFPQVAQNDSKGGRIRLFQLLYEQYSRLEFSNAADRPVAIAGLEQRLVRAFETSGGFGIFERYLGRSILWTRAPNIPNVSTVRKLVKIPIPQQQEAVPSWSWMAYEGGISFLDPPFDGVDWSAGDEFSSPWTSQSPSSLQTRQQSTCGADMCLNVVTRDFVQDADGLPDSLSSIVWDDETVFHSKVKCVVVAKLRNERECPRQRHWVLIVQWNELRGVYERIGAGSLPKDRILFQNWEHSRVF